MPSLCFSGLVYRRQSPAGTSKGRRGKKGQVNGDSEKPPTAANLTLVVDQLLSQYHKAIVAGLALSCMPSWVYLMLRSDFAGANGHLMPLCWC